jgi:hypothetical protein
VDEMPEPLLLRLKGAALIGKNQGGTPRRKVQYNFFPISISDTLQGRGRKLAFDSL